ncbi:NAD(P)/FAD-dependent oxidoreductase [Mogibacterium pumilum]|uniref:FAD/NAD(P)-binding oxidoreductase n=1 Tax=Mogibacterium pumilum TaxID=86332 RepID=A0A223AQY3_9FIRM|nr:NAD(P)/FAD-dependent oxidoreductase [Mogibacterium pumilum]ASS37355.1 FAD/NAD(P)-binding oxidoreductase [Mogibacterium pumilum]
MLYDIAIIGAGITGSMLARELSRYELKIAVLDKENDIANGATMANSAIVHTGYDPVDGTLKAELNVKGARKYPKICEDLHCHIKNTGAFVVACSDEDEALLDVLAERAVCREIPHEFLSGDEARTVEPNLSDNITKALSFPTTSVIYPWEVAIACMQVAVGNGVELFLNHAVSSIDKDAEGYVITAGSETFHTKVLLNASGVGAADICRMVTENVGFEVTPRRGEYYVISNDEHIVNNVIFPVPTAKGKGVLAIPTVYGNTLIGPNSEQLAENISTATSVNGASYLREHITKIIKTVPLHKSIRTFAGLRPSTTSKDFIIEPLGAEHPNFINIASIESPGLASAPGIADYVIENFVADRFCLKESPDAVMTREKPIVVSELSEEERDKLVRENPQYANIVCRCETISEGEIVSAIHEVCGARSVKGIKKRVRPGMGKCQGGFCEPKVVEILARELKCSPVDIVQDGKHSQILEKENR